MDRHFLKRMDTQKLESSVQSAGQGELLVVDGHHEVNSHRNPDLGLHCIGAGTEVVFDSEMSLDPFEEEFDLPAALVELGHRDGRDLQIVGEEDEILGCLLVEVTHSAKRPWEVGMGFWKRRTSDLIAANSIRVIPRQRTLTGEAEVALGPSDEEGTRQNDASKPCKIHVAAIHHIEGPRFEGQVVEPVNIGFAGSRDVDACRDRASQIELSVHLDPCFGTAEVGPREETQREVDGGGVERVNRVLQFQSEILSGVKDTRLAHEPLCQIFPESPVPLLVGIRQSGLGHRFPKTQVIEGFGASVEAGGDVAQSLPPGQLCKSHTDQLLTAAKMANPTLRVVAFDETEKCLAIHQIEDLRKDAAARVHGQPSSKPANQKSNAWHPFYLARL